MLSISLEIVAFASCSQRIDKLFTRKIKKRPKNHLKNQRRYDERASIVNPAQLRSLSLWSDFKKEYGLSLCYDELCQFWDSDPESWSFWRLWYDGYLFGTPLNNSIVSSALGLHPDQLVGSAVSVSKRITVKGTGAALISQIENVYKILTRIPQVTY